MRQNIGKKKLQIIPILSVFFLASTSVTALAGKELQYTCNEGIPLVIEFINTKAASIAIISHDSSPRIALDSVPSGSGAKYSNGDWVLHVKGTTAMVGTQGEFDDTCTLVASTMPKEPVYNEVTLPRKAKSWGGIVRSGPGQKYRKLASLREGEWITILKRTNKMFNGHPWFKIKYRGRIGFKWGGILCSVGEQIEGTYQTCN